eukprot:s1614_g24.t4
MLPSAALPSSLPPVRQAVCYRMCPGSRVSRARLCSCKVQEVDQVVQEGVQPSRLAQLRRGQKVASVAAFAASLLGLAHLVLYVFTPGSRPSWLGRSRRHGIEARVALSGFLSAHPLEFPGLLLASSAVTGACEAAAQVNCSRNYRSLYISLAIAGLCYIFDESAVAQQIRAVASTGTTGALFIVAYVVYSCLDWLSNGISISEVFLGVRATRKLGLPQPWKAAEPSGVRLLPKLYAIAELMCLLEMGRPQRSVSNPRASSDSTWVLEPAPTEQVDRTSVHPEVPELQRQVRQLELQLRTAAALPQCVAHAWMQLGARLCQRRRKLAKRGDHLWRIIEIMPEGTDADIRILETAASWQLYAFSIRNAKSKYLACCEEDGSQVEVTVLRMPRSTLWRLGRLLPVLAALDELRRISSRPEQLSSPEAAQLNKGVGFWAWSALLEAALLGVLCSSWARHLGYTGPGVAFSGLATAALAAAPACVVLAASFMGWSRSESALVELTRARPEQPWERLGRYDLQKLEGLYVDGITKYYSEFYDRPSSTGDVKKLNDCEYYRIKVRLKKAGSKVLRYCRADIQQLVCQAQETQESVVPVNDVEEKLPATRAAAEEQEASTELLQKDELSKAESEPMAPSAVVEVQAVLEDVETKPPTKEPETQEGVKKEELRDGSEEEEESKEQSEEEAKEDKANEGRTT